ncbi:hypothetical protein F4819DRAFT_415318 [Hypoxylon fuscum]|nr:hypothetical protein F4819DRAFT_415318 [Hypoxylon fuscum]
MLEAFGYAARKVSIRMPDIINELKRHCQQRATPSDYKLASSIKSNVLHYDVLSVSSTSSDVVRRLPDEWYQALSRGPGVLILQDFLIDRDLLNRTNNVFDTIIKDEATSAKGDHFATSSANSRI